MARTKTPTRDQKLWNIVLHPRFDTLRRLPYDMWQLHLNPATGHEFPKMLIGKLATVIDEAHEEIHPEKGT